jgi:hypothetical protein
VTDQFAIDPVFMDAVVMYVRMVLNMITMSMFKPRFLTTTITTHLDNLNHKQSSHGREDAINNPLTDKIDSDQLI